jgi:hypothetical protein
MEPILNSLRRIIKVEQDLAATCEKQRVFISQKSLGNWLERRRSKVSAKLGEGCTHQCVTALRKETIFTKN